MEQSLSSDKTGYYTVFVGTGVTKLPYTVFALSDYHAARLINQATGYLAAQHDIEGPYRHA